VHPDRIYLDHAATTPLLVATRNAMDEALERWHNPSSPHAEGRAARTELEDARARIARVLDWPGNVIFTSGASEALAIALQRTLTDDVHVSAVEHDAVFRAVPDAPRIAVDARGIVDRGALGGAGGLVAVQQANNETGVLQPLTAIAEDLRGTGAILLADCAQTAAKLPLPNVDLIAISAHKFGGPPGTGALLVRDLSLLQAVGGQEQGYRYGTENLPAILGMAAALEAQPAWIERAAALRARLDGAIAANGGEIVASDTARLSTIGAYRMPGVAANAQLIHFDMAGIAVSAGSACSSGSLKPSHVLAAMGWEESAAREVIRVSFGPETTVSELDRFVSVWIEMADRRRAA
jgi:cysteine desulfurase